MGALHRWMARDAHRAGCHQPRHRLLPGGGELRRGHGHDLQHPSRHRRSHRAASSGLVPIGFRGHRIAPLQRRCARPGGCGRPHGLSHLRGHHLRGGATDRHLVLGAVAGPRAHRRGPAVHPAGVVGYATRPHRHDPGGASAQGASLRESSSSRPTRRLYDRPVAQAISHLFTMLWRTRARSPARISGTRWEETC